MRPGKLRCVLDKFGREFDHFFGLPAVEQTRVEINRYRIVRILLHLRAILGDQWIAFDEDSAHTGFEITLLNIEVAGIFF